MKYRIMEFYGRFQPQYWQAPSYPESDPTWHDASLNTFKTLDEAKKFLDNVVNPPKKYHDYP